MHLAVAKITRILIVGNKKCPHHQAFRMRILESFRWSPWQADAFTMTGTEVQQLPDCTILLSQAHDQELQLYVYYAID